MLNGNLLSDIERRSLSSLSDRILYKMKIALQLTSERQGFCFISAHSKISVCAARSEILQSTGAAFALHALTEPSAGFCGKPGRYSSDQGDNQRTHGIAGRCWWAFRGWAHFSPVPNCGLHKWMCSAFGQDQIVYLHRLPAEIILLVWSYLCLVSLKLRFSIDPIPCWR